MSSGRSRRTVLEVTVDSAPENGPVRPGWDRRWTVDAVIAVVVAAVQVEATYVAATHQGRSISVLGYLLLALAGLALVARRPWTDRHDGEAVVPVAPSRRRAPKYRKSSAGTRRLEVQDCAEQREQ